MFKLCVALVILGCVATLIEGQTRLSPYQQQQKFNRNAYYQQNGVQPSRYQPNFYQPKNNNKNYYRPSAAFVPHGAIGNEDLAKTIVEHNNAAQADGAYEYVYETENGIRAEERNLPKSLSSGEPSANAEGSYAYTSPEGLKVLVTYVADEDGFRPILSYSGNGAEQYINNDSPSSVTINKNA